MDSVQASGAVVFVTIVISALYLPICLKRLGEEWEEGFIRPSLSMFLCVVIGFVAFYLCAEIVQQPHLKNEFYGVVAGLATIVWAYWLQPNLSRRYFKGGL